MFERGIDYLFNEVTLYTKESFNVFELKDNKYQYNQDQFLRFLYYIGMEQNKLVTYCHKCKKEFPFNIKKKLFEFIQETGVSYMTISGTGERSTDSHIDMSNGK